MKDLPISNEELLSLLKLRLSTRGKTKPRLDIKNDVIYQEYLDECSSLMGEGVTREIKNV